MSRQSGVKACFVAWLRCAALLAVLLVNVAGSTTQASALAFSSMPSGEHRAALPVTAARSVSSSTAVGEGASAYAPAAQLLRRASQDAVGVSAAEGISASTTGNAAAISKGFGELSRTQQSVLVSRV